MVQRKWLGGAWKAGHLIMIPNYLETMRPYFCMCASRLILYVTALMKSETCAISPHSFRDATKINLWKINKSDQPSPPCWERALLFCQLLIPWLVKRAFYGWSGSFSTNSTGKVSSLAFFARWFVNQVHSLDHSISFNIKILYCKVDFTGNYFTYCEISPCLKLKNQVMVLAHMCCCNTFPQFSVTLD